MAKIQQISRKDARRVHYAPMHHIFLYLTERCQLKCGHCYMGDRHSRALALTKEQAFSMLDAFYRLGSRELTLLGGEPSLCRYLPEVVTYAHELGYEGISIDTNALNVTRLLRIDPSLLKYIRVSLDGATAASHEIVRGQGTYLITLENIRRLLKCGYPVAITSTFFSFNLKEGVQLLGLAEDLGVQLLNLHVFSEEGFGATKTIWSVSPREWIRFCEIMHSVGRDKNFAVWYPPGWCEETELDRFITLGFRGCLGLAIDRLSVFPDGRCYICSLLFDYDMSFAIFRDESIRLNKNDNEFDLFLKSHMKSRMPQLSGCPAEALFDKKVGRICDPLLIPLCRCWKVQI